MAEPDVQVFTELSETSTMSESGYSHFPVAIVQAYIGSLVETTIIQSLLTGFYTLLFFQTVAPLARLKKWPIMAALTALFFSIIINLAAVWKITYTVVVTNNATRDTMAEAELSTSHTLSQKMAYGTLALSVLMADSFLVWKAYILWEKSKIIGIVYSIVCLTELVTLPIYLARNITLGPRLGFMDLYFAVSFVSTIVATVLILYKIIDISKLGNNKLSRYQFAMKVLVESGMLYITVIGICSVLHIIQIFDSTSPGLIRATQDFGALLVPVTGIAPTLITARNAAARESQDRTRPDIEANNNESEIIVSGLNFRREDSNIELPVSEVDITRNSGKNIQTRTV